MSTTAEGHGELCGSASDYRRARGIADAVVPPLEAGTSPNPPPGPVNPPNGPSSGGGSNPPPPGAPANSPSSDGGAVVVRPPGNPPPGGNAGSISVPPGVGAVVPPAVVSSIANTATGLRTIVTETERQDFLDNILDVRSSVVASARADNETAAEPYRRLPLEQLGQYLGRAEQTIGDTVKDLQAARGGMDPSELARFQNVYMNARDKAALGMAALAEEDRRARPLGDVTPFAGLLGPNAQNPLARTASLAEVFGAADASSGGRKLAGQSDSAAVSAETLTNRIVMLNGLPPDQREAALGRMKLVERVSVRDASGKSRLIPILHNGYIFGAGASGLDCSSFVSSALPPDVRKGRFTTLDFRQMWIYAKTGTFPKPPNYDKGRSALVREASGAFEPIDLYRGDPLVAGDLLVYRLPWEPSGHVFVVRRYDERTMTADVIEAAQSAGTVRERQFSLSMDPSKSHIRLIRPGLLALRLRPQHNRVCGLKTAISRPQAPLQIPDSGSSSANRRQTGAL